MLEFDLEELTAAILQLPAEMRLRLEVELLRNRVKMLEAALAAVGGPKK